jgi:hypothetical protein
VRVLFLCSIGCLYATPLVVAYLLWRSHREPECRAHWAERIGLRPRRADRSSQIRIHSVSIGGTRAAQPLVSAFAAAYPQARILVTAMTATRRETAREVCARPFGARFARLTAVRLRRRAAALPGRLAAVGALARVGRAHAGTRRAGGSPAGGGARGIPRMGRAST